MTEEEDIEELVDAEIHWVSECTKDECHFSCGLCEKQFLKFVYQSSLSSENHLNSLIDHIDMNNKDDSDDENTTRL